MLHYGNRIRKKHYKKYLRNRRSTNAAKALRIASNGIEWNEGKPNNEVNNYQHFIIFCAGEITIDLFLTGNNMTQGKVLMCNTNYIQ